MGKTERIGVAKVRLIVNEELGWVFREQSEEDYGIDAQIEIRGQTYLTGKLLGVQIKSGDSYFSEINGDKVVFRFDAKHYNYWTNLPFYTIVVLYSPSTKICIWQVIDEATVKITDKGNCRIDLSRFQVFNKDSKTKLLILAYKKDLKKLAEASIDIFENEQDIKTFYLDLDENQKIKFKEGLEELLERNVTSSGVSLVSQDDFVTVILEILKGFPSIVSYEKKNAVNNRETLILGKSFLEAYRHIEKDYLSNNKNNIVITGVPGIGKSTLVDLVRKKYKNNTILLKGQDFHGNSKLRTDSNTSFVNGQKSKIKVFILDGWDEICTEDQEVARKFILNLVENKFYKVIITSRYIPDFCKANTLRQWEYLRLERLTDSEILSVLRKEGILNEKNMNMTNILKNMQQFNTPALLKGAVFISKSLNIALDKMTSENIFYAAINQQDSITNYHLQNLAFNMFKQQKNVLEISHERREEFEKINELHVESDTVQFIHATVYEMFLAQKIFKLLFEDINKFETNIKRIFAYGIPTVGTFDFIKILINKSGNFADKISLLNHTFINLLETGGIGANIDGIPYFKTVASIFYSIWHLIIYINKHFYGYYKLEKSNNIEKNLVCLIDIFNKFYFSEKYLDFSGLDISDFKLWRCNAININFKGSILRNVNFNVSCLCNSNFENADMTNCQLLACNLESANLKNAKLYNSNIARCIIREESLTDILKYKDSLKGLDSLIVNMGRKEYITYSEYVKKNNCS